MIFKEKTFVMNDSDNFINRQSLFDPFIREAFAALKLTIVHVFLMKTFTHSDYNYCGINSKVMVPLCLGSALKSAENKNL
jgi:hypothetical protein